MRRFSTANAATAAIALLVSTLLSTDVLALEKTSRILAEDRPHEWNARGTTCSIAYYNTCTGWIWMWSGWFAGDRFGVQFNPCCPTTTRLQASWVHFIRGAPPGYGFTGNVDVWAGDALRCPTGAALASQPFLPQSGWNLIDFGAGVSVPSWFVITYTAGANGLPATLTSEHPAAGPTGPPACGTCYPSTRTNHSFYWGSAASPLCPGSTLNDLVCDAQLLWDAQVSCGEPVSIESSSWTEIKALYR